MDFRTGDIFLDEYEILHPIGKGAFARVYRAHQPRLDRDVAIKFLQLDDEVARKRYRVEARIIAHLRNPATVRVYDYGLFEDTPYMVLEFVVGKTLREVLDWQAPFEPDRAIHIVVQILESLAEAHAAGVIHRDLKPSNIMLFLPGSSPEDERIKVLDFGLAKVTAEAKANFLSHQGRLTAMNSTVGTLNYMSREQLRGRTVTPASDLYSVGILLYEMLTGTHPYEDRTGMDLVIHIVEGEPIRLPADCDVPKRLAQITHRLIVRDLEHRYQSADDVLHDLAEFQDPTYDETSGVQMPGFMRQQTPARRRSYVSLLPNDPQSLGGTESSVEPTCELVYENREETAVEDTASPEEEVNGTGAAASDAPGSTVRTSSSVWIFLAILTLMALVLAMIAALV